MQLAQIWIPILTVILGVANTIYSKNFLTKSKIPYKKHLVYTFIWLTILTLPLALIDGNVDLAQAFAFKNLVLLLGVVILALLANWWLLNGFRKENLVRYDLVVILQPLVIIAAAALFLPEERDLRIWMVAVISTLALGFAHLRRQHISFDAGEKILFLGIFAWGLHEVLARLLLEVYSPAIFYFVRTAILTIIFMLAFRVPLPKFNHYHNTGTFIGAALSVGSILLLYYSYQIFGVTLTNAIGLLSPVLIYVAAVKIFGVREPWRMAVATLVILASLLYLILFVLK